MTAALLIAGCLILTQTTGESHTNLPIEISIDAPAVISLHIPSWDTFRLEGLQPGLTIDQQTLQPEKASVTGEGPNKNILYSLGGNVQLQVSFETVDNHVLRLTSTLKNTAANAVTLNDVRLLDTADAAPGACFSNDIKAVRVLEQGNYWGRVVPLLSSTKNGGESAEPGSQQASESHGSEFVSLAYDRASKLAFLAGFESSERWAGRIDMESRTDTGACRWRIGFDGGDLLVNPGEEISFEPVLFLAGNNPWHLLEHYADLVAQKHPVHLPAEPPVSWCSWYPYRLGVTEDRVLDTARIASERLKPLGLSVLLIDLGWQDRQLPSTYGENPQFSKGLKWLSEEVGKLGFSLGVWNAPYSISEFDALTKEHPEWLIHEGNGQLAKQSDWFWVPHGAIYIPDLTNPEMQHYLKANIESLYARGIRYLKSDFIGSVYDGRAKRRYDARIVAGGGVEAARIGAKIIREAMPDALLLNCGGPEMPGTGHWPLLYTCSDTGNTGFISTTFQESNYQNVACHLFKNRRWGILQPSCLCVGFPGTLEDARLRATIAFLTGGQVDIGDTLTTLPEDRWEILTATLPPLGITTEPIDLFEGITAPADYGYSSTCADGPQKQEKRKEYPAGSVWKTHVKTDWDEWDLIGIFCYENTLSQKDTSISRYQIPFSLLGFAETDTFHGYEFWSRQCLGTVPGRRTNPNGYEHPGDIQDLQAGNTPGLLDIAFFGPTVKLLCLKKPRSHPWIAGTSFHQSCGAELKGVAWDESKKSLAGVVQRPVGEIGYLFISAGGKTPVAAEVNGQPVSLQPAAQGAWRLPIQISVTPTSWKVMFK
ncbi:MAG TPA: alpha-galactosidase [Candidatus Hydrogenedentes bacterium]|nr:alpha-galactosidase [Candidatus Hydrogenedentota bacterium]